MNTIKEDLLTRLSVEKSDLLTRIRAEQPVKTTYNLSNKTGLIILLSGIAAMCLIMLT